MRKRGCASGFALADLVMPAAVLMLVTSIGSWVYARHFRRQHETRTRQLVAQVLECDPDEVLAEAQLSKIRRAQAPRARRPLAAAVEGRRSERAEADSPAESGQESAAAPQSARERAKRTARGKTSRSRDVDAAMAGRGMSSR